MRKAGKLALGRERIDEIISAAADRLAGDFLLVGGALVAMTSRARRLTEDVDLVGLRGTARERYQLIELASSLGLPVEAINSAADYFVKRIPGWRKELVLLRQGRRARIFRPSSTLFLLLKIGRLSEQDFGDCKFILAEVAAGRLESVDRELVVGAIERAVAAEKAVTRRREKLRRLLAS